jgi:predicted PurR-regulated permease PerM
MWPVSQDFPFLIVPSVFNNVYLEENVSNILYIKFKPFGFQAPKDFALNILKSIVSLSSHFVFFLIITIFSLYYFYIDGERIIKRLKDYRH